MRAEVRQAQGIILGTPEYHGGYSGVLKNALDLMGFEEFEGKMVGLVGVSGGAMGAFGAMNSLREIGRALHAWVIPGQASIPQAWQEFDEAGNLKDAELNKRVRAVGRQVARFAYLHGSCEANEFLGEVGESPRKSRRLKKSAMICGIRTHFKNSWMKAYLLTTATVFAFLTVGTYGELPQRTGEIL